MLQVCFFPPVQSKIASVEIHCLHYQSINQYKNISIHLFIYIFIYVLTCEMQTEKNIEINELKNRWMNNLNGKLNVKVNKYIQKQINIKISVLHVIWINFMPTFISHIMYFAFNCMIFICWFIYLVIVNFGSLGYP